MLKLNASYSKKVPAESEYSSQSYHATIEIELPDGLTQNQLQARIHETFALVRDSVETELHCRTAEPMQQAIPDQTPSQAQNMQERAYPAGNNGLANGDVPASSCLLQGLSRVWKPGCFTRMRPA